MATDYPKILPIGDSAFLVLFGDAINDAVNDAAVAYCERLDQAALPGVQEAVSTSRSVLVRFDPLSEHYQTVRQGLEGLLSQANLLGDSQPAQRRIWDVPVCYGGEFGPDLPDVAALMGVSETDAIADHQSAKSRVNMIGFAPGVLYCGLLGPQWDIPRLQHAKPNVAAGSVSVAVRQTVIYPIENPTGWRTIGRTPLSSFDPARQPPMHVRQGDEIRFRAIDEHEYADLCARQSRFISPDATERA